MANLFIFGCSYCNDYKSIQKFGKGAGGQYDYLQWWRNKYQTEPTHFQDEIKNNFGLSTIYNYARGGYDNYSILESVMKHYNEIKKNDYVIVGWSDITRFRRVGYNKQNNPYWQVQYINEEESVWQEQSFDRDNQLVMNELNTWTEYLKKTLPSKSLFWSTFHTNAKNLSFQTYMHEDIVNDLKKEPTITYDTNGEVSDNHWSTDGHKQVGKWLSYQITQIETIL